MNIIKFLLIFSFLIGQSCKEANDQDAGIQSQDAQNVNKNSVQNKNKKAIRVSKSGQDIKEFEIQSTTSNSQQLETEYNLTLDQVYLSRDHLFELLLNDARIAFLSNDLSIKSKHSFQTFNGCNQFLLATESEDEQNRADLILLSLERELVVSEEDHYGVVCIEQDKIWFDFRSEIASADAMELLRNTIFYQRQADLSLLGKFGKIGWGKRFSTSKDVKLPSQYRPTLSKRTLNKKISKNDEVEAEDYVTRVKNTDDINLIESTIYGMTYPQTLHFLRRYLSDTDLRSHAKSADIRKAIEGKLIDKIDDSPKQLLPETNGIAAGGYMTPANIPRYLDYLNANQQLKLLV